MSDFRRSFSRQARHRGNRGGDASRLGEDIATPGEILVTQSAIERVPQSARPVHELVTVSVSGVDIAACSVRY